MSHATRKCVVALAALAAMLSGPGAGAEESEATFIAFDVAAELRAPMDGDGVVATARANPLGIKPLDSKSLARKRGGADVLNDLQLKGVVSDNRAINVSTGNNVIADGAFTGTVGMPMVVQNTGNNVLIQNATIVNVQVK